MPNATPIEPFAIVCLRCEREILAHPSWVGREVDCPHCQSALRVPKPARDGRPVRGEAPYLAPGRVFNFACPRCDCLLEAHSGMSGQLARCPTCAARFEVPDVHPRTGLPKPARELVDAPEPGATDADRTAAQAPAGQPVGAEAFGRAEQVLPERRETESRPGRKARPPGKADAGHKAAGDAPAQDGAVSSPAKASPPAGKRAARAAREAPQPMHAYGASGHQAPRILRLAGGEMRIECPRCSAHNGIDADRCGACGAPFTLEATPTAKGVETAGLASAALTCGLLGLLLFPLVVPGLLAIGFGVRAISGGISRASLGSFLGLILGLLAVVAGVFFWAMM